MNNNSESILEPNFSICLQCDKSWINEDDFSDGVFICCEICNRSLFSLSKIDDPERILYRPDGFDFSITKETKQKIKDKCPYYLEHTIV